MKIYLVVFKLNTTCVIALSLQITTGNLKTSNKNTLFTLVFLYNYCCCSDIYSYERRLGIV